MRRALRWLGAFVGVLVALIAGMVGVGWALPVAHTATVSERLEAPGPEVWRLVTEVDRFPKWRPEVREVVPLDDGTGLPSWREETTTGPLPIAVEVWDPPRRLVTRIAGEGLPFGGTWTYEIVPEGDGARLTIIDDGEVYNPFFRFMARFVFGHEATLLGYLEAARLEIERRAGGA